jgi:predicted nucleotidyltransferase
VHYERHELLPKKRGQVRYAERRSAAWDALLPNVVLTTTVGSRAWGLATEKSDTDIRGVFALPLSWTVGLRKPPRDLVSADGSQTYWEVAKTFEQALRADPNTLETLFVTSATATDEVGEWLLSARNAFVSKRIYASFGRYALAQLQRLRQSSRLAEHRSKILDWLREDPDLALDDVAARLAEADLRKSATTPDRMHQAKEYVKQLYRSMHDQGLLASSDFASLARFAGSAEYEFTATSELRPKNAYNLLRLIRTATDWLRTGEPEFAMSGEFREVLLAIKSGQVDLHETLRQAEEMTAVLEAAHKATRLPGEPDYALADQALRNIQLEIARRHVVGADTVFGLRVAPFPPVELET